MKWAGRGKRAKRGTKSVNEGTLNRQCRVAGARCAIEMLNVVQQRDVKENCRSKAMGGVNRTIGYWVYSQWGSILHKEWIRFL
jgi:hypothetical protein